MEIVCFDMEGTLTPEIWEQIALNTGVEEFNKTTRDIPDYSDLMDFRLEVMKKHNLKLSDIQKASGELNLLDGAEDFLNSIRSNFQVVILSDTFHEIAISWNVSERITTWKLDLILFKKSSAPSKRFNSPDAFWISDNLRLCFFMTSSLKSIRSE